MAETVREYRADRRRRGKAVALIAVMLMCGVLEVVINDVPGWISALLISVLVVVDGWWALSLWRRRTVVRPGGITVVGALRVREWAWHDIRDIRAEPARWAPAQRLAYLFDTQGRKAALPCVSESALPALHAEIVSLRGTQRP